MSSDSYPGVVVAETYELRFAYSGKVVSARKKAGDPVKQWETIASLDRKVLQMELDRQLADYEKARAEFELFNKKAGGDGDDITKFLRQEKQASLNAAVKEVELAKYRLDQADLISPVAGIITDAGGLIPGLYVTPSGNPVSVQKTSAFRFRFSVPQEDLGGFLSAWTVEVSLSGREDKLRATGEPPAGGRDGQFELSALLPTMPGILPGLTGQAKRSPA